MYINYSVYQYIIYILETPWKISMHIIIRLIIHNTGANKPDRYINQSPINKITKSISSHKTKYTTSTLSENFLWNHSSSGENWLYKNLYCLSLSIYIFIYISVKAYQVQNSMNKPQIYLFIYLYTYTLPANTPHIY